MADSGDAQAWFQFAEADFQYGMTGLEEFPRGAGYMLGQACEKYLKALLLHAGEDAPRTHDTQVLIELLPQAPDNTSREWAAAALIARAAVPNRYPGLMDEPTPEEAQAIARAAGVVREFARARMGL